MHRPNPLVVLVVALLATLFSVSPPGSPRAVAGEAKDNVLKDKDKKVDESEGGEASGKCKLTNLYYIFSNGRVYAFIRNDMPGKVVVKGKLKVGWVDKAGQYMGSKFLYVNEMWLPPDKSGIYFWVVSDYLDREVGGIRLEGFWVWFKDQ